MFGSASIFVPNPHLSELLKMSSIIARVEDDPSGDVTASASTAMVNHPVSATLKHRHGNSIKVLSYKRRRLLKFVS